MVKYKYGGKGGKQFSLKVSEDLVGVRLKKQKTLETAELADESKTLLPRLMLVSTFSEANVAIYRCVGSDSGSRIRVRNQARTVLGRDKAIRFAGRILVNDFGQTHLYTENGFIKFSDSLKVVDCKRILKEAGFKVMRRSRTSKNSFFIKGAEDLGMQVFEDTSKLLARQDVELCHPELIRERRLKAAYTRQWHLKKSSFQGKTIDAHVSAEKAWQRSKGKGATVAIIDHGIDIDHPEFSGRSKVVSPRDIMEKTDNPRPQFLNEAHGTACAGVAVGNGRQKASGVAPEAALMPIRLLANLGSLAEAEAIEWAVDQGADVISCSWGPEDGDWDQADDPRHIKFQPLPDSTREAIDYAVEKGRNGKGCIVVWAAGNGRENVQFDGYASYEKVLAIAACNDTDRRSVYSDFGEQVFCCFPSGDQGYAPFNHPAPLSSGIWTTDNLGASGYNAGSNFADVNVGDSAGSYTARFGGTSSATPGVAGVIALILSVNPELSEQEVRQILKVSCEKIDPGFGAYDAQGHSVYYGYGKLNAELAVLNAQATVESLPDFQVRGHLGFKRQGASLLQDGQAVNSAKRRDKLIGISLQLQPFHPGLSIDYQLIYNRIGAGSIGKDGLFISHDDKRRKAVGIRVWLRGDLKDQYSVRYKVRKRRESNWLSAADGQVCGTASGRGEAIVGVEVSVAKR